MTRTILIAGTVAGGLLLAFPLYAGTDIPVLKAEPHRTLVAAANPPTPSVIMREEPRLVERVLTSPAYRLYVPPRRGYTAPALRMGGSTRGSSGLQPAVAVLAPNHVGETTWAHPTLYWYAAEDVTTRVEFTLIAHDAVKPLVSVTLPGPIRRGVHPIRLADYAVSLEPGTIYEWSIALVGDSRHRSHDVVAIGEIERISIDKPLGFYGQDGYLLFAAHGLWYDAVMAVTDLLETAQAPATLRLDRAALAEEVGLSVVAVYDRTPVAQE
jgi:hypothetical protein